MRDPELMLALLREMAAEPSGEIFALQTYGMSKEQQQRRHHIDLLADIGQAQWTGRHAARITHAGHDYLNHVGAGKRFHRRFIEFAQAGKTYAEIVVLVQKLGEGLPFN